MPIYGSFVIRINWYFVVLTGKEYCMSEAFNSRKDKDLFQIFRILKAQRRMIEERIKVLTVQ